MIRRLQLFVLLMIVLLMFTLWGCGNRNESPIQPGHEETKEDFIRPEDIDNTGRIDDETENTEAGAGQKDTENNGAKDAENNDVSEVINKMTLDEKIGQMFIVGFESQQPDDALKDMIVNNHVGGVILFKRNIKDPLQLLGLINTIKDINIDGIPLFISVDEEGGKVSRMPDQIKDIPSSLSVGERKDKELSYKVGSLLAHKVKAFGFNMNFAPVLDIWSNPKNTVIGDRAFGTRPEIVSSLGIESMKGIRDKGVIPVVKHFPGHGDTIVDSHIGLPTVEYELDRLKSFEFVPFQAAIDHGTDAVMIAHILMEKIDPLYPATLSKTLITDILRKDIGFEGLVVTDDMTMGAIIKNYSIEDAVVGSIAAGSDIILICHGYDNQQVAINAVKAAVRDGILTEGRIEESVKRILKLKQKYELTNQAIDSVNVDEINEKIDGITNSSNS